MSTFKRFVSDDIVLANATEVTLGLWPGGTGSLSENYPLAAQSSSTSGQYYWDGYDMNPTSSDAQVCFAVAYGHRTGAGHPSLNIDETSTLATQAVYSQYRNLLLDPGDSQFTFYGGYNSDNIFVINVYRYLMKERLDSGNWRLSLASASTAVNFIDDSGQALGVAFGKSGQVFNVVEGDLSGSLGSTIISSGSAIYGGFGLFYPSLGVIVLNPNAIAERLGWPSGSYYRSGSAFWQPVTSSITLAEVQANKGIQYNHVSLFNAINLGDDFQARSAENISSTHYFVRLRAAEFNYSNNPTFFDETNGTIVYTSFIQDPRVYVTTIGMYNDNNELLAVSKLSKAIQKGFDKEINLRVRLDFVWFLALIPAATYITHMFGVIMS